MLYSRSNRLIFVHVQRTGGTSLGALLRRQLPDASRIGGLEHLPLSRARDLMGRPAFALCYRFGFVRNPWDRAVSLYCHAKQRGRIIRAKLRVTRQTDFREFLDRQHWYLDHPQTWWLCDADGGWLATDVFRFEQYLEAVQIICERFGLDPAGLPHRKPSRHGHYTTYYDDTTRRLVAERYAADIKAFGYKFGE